MTPRLPPLLLLLLLHLFESSSLSVSLPPLPSSSSYLFSEEDNSTAVIGSWTGVHSQGKLSWPNTSASPARFHTLTSLVTPEEVKSILQIVRSSSFELDEDLDSVDKASTYEFYVERSGTADGIKDIEGKPDQQEEVFNKRKPTREQLSSIMMPILQERVLPFVNSQYEQACSLSNASCTVCHSLVRKYSEEERLVHPSHFDLQALVTVVVSLSSFGVDFEGGLYVSTGAGLNQAKYVPMQAGDAVFHQSNLLHGVKVEKGTRWSWILWLKDTEDCNSDEPHLLKWTAADAERGDPVAQFLHGKRTSFVRSQLYWFNRSASSGFFEAANEMGQFFNDNSMNQKNNNLAAQWFFQATEHAPNDPKAFYNLGRLAIEEKNFVKAVKLFEMAAMNGLSLAAFNMGVAHYKGLGVEQDLSLAALWMERANSGQSYMIAHDIWTNLGEVTKAMVALTRSGQTGHIPALRQLAAVTLPLCESLLLQPTAEEFVAMGIDGEGTFQRYKNKLMEDISSLLSVNPSDAVILDVCMNGTAQNCSAKLKKKVIAWLVKAAKMGCFDCLNDLDQLKKSDN